MPVMTRSNLRLAARVGVGVALYQAAAAQHLDRKVVIGGQMRQRGGKPCLQMRHLLRVAQRAAPPAAQAAHDMQHQEAAQAVGAQVAALVEPAVEPGHPDRIGGNLRAQSRGQQPGDFLGTRVQEFGQLHQIGVADPHLAPDAARSAAARVLRSATRMTSS